MNKLPNISLILLTKNESENIQKNFNWLSKCPRINELICIDDLSTDDTRQKIQQLNSKNLQVNFFSRGLDNNFSLQRQFAVDKSKNNTILWLDADEQPSSELINFLNNTDTGNYNYAFKRQDEFLGKILKHGETNNQYFLRLFNKKIGSFSGMVHEKWVSSQQTIESNHVIIHHPHPTLKTFFSKINYYSSIRAQELKQQQKTASVLSLITYPIAKFIYDYIILLGFLDGTPGIILALGMSFQSFLSRAKLWHSWQTPSTG